MGARWDIFFPMLLREFLNELQRRRESSTLVQLSEELCVSYQAVQQWLTGQTTPSNMVLRIAERCWRAPRELAAGLPANGQAKEG